MPLHAWIKHAYQPYSQWTHWRIDGAISAEDEDQDRVVGHEGDPHRIGVCLRALGVKRSQSGSTDANTSYLKETHPDHGPIRVGLSTR